MTREIPLSQGKSALIDDDDFERKFRDPNGIIFDINWKGWTMTSGKVKSAAAQKKVGKKTKKLTKTGKKARKR